MSWFRRQRDNTLPRRSNGRFKEPSEKPLSYTQGRGYQEIATEADNRDKEFWSTHWHKYNAGLPQSHGKCGRCGISRVTGFPHTES